MKARIKGIGTYRLIVDTRCHVVLEGCLYVLGYARNLVFVAKMDELGFSFKIGNNVFSLFKDMYYYGFGTLKDGLYCFNLDAKFMESLFNVECDDGSKQNVHDDNSSYLWHQRLGHISKERIMRLVTMKFCLNWISVIGIYVWIALKERKPNKYQRILLQEVMNF